MSLKAFHIVFIVISILLGFGIGTFCLWQWYDGADSSSLALGFIFLTSGVVLLAYSRHIIKKMEKYSYL
mgnify:CR=1 FL=1